MEMQINLNQTKKKNLQVKTAIKSTKKIKKEKLIKKLIIIKRKKKKKKMKKKIMMMKINQKLVKKM